MNRRGGGANCPMCAGQLSASPANIKRSPTLGEHTEEILKEVLGYDGGKIESLKGAGAFSAPKKVAA